MGGGGGTGAATIGAAAGAEGGEGVVARAVACPECTSRAGSRGKGGAGAARTGATGAIGPEKRTASLGKNCRGEDSGGVNWRPKREGSGYTNTWSGARAAMIICLDWYIHGRQDFFNHSRWIVSPENSGNHF